MTLFVVSGAFLAGLVAAGVPLALHLLNRRPKEEIPFPGLLFLLQSETKARSGGSWRRRLILLCRVLAVAALCLAFCQPFLSSVGVAPGRATVLLWDDSFSMQLPPGYARLKAQFEAALRETSPASPATVGIVRGSRILWNGPFTGDAEELLGFFRQNALNQSTSNFAEVARQSDFRLRELPAEKRRVLLFTDRQELPWRRTPREEAFENATEFCVIRPEPVTVRNAAVTGAELSTAPGSLTVRATVRNYSDALLPGTLYLELAGTRRASLPVDLKPGAEASFLLTAPLPAGDITGRIELETGDDLKPDNSFYFSRAAGHERTRAPAPEQHRVNLPALAVGVADAPAEVPREAAGKLLIWQDPAGLTPEVQEKLEKFLQSGGVCAVTLEASPRIATFLDRYSVRMSPGRAEEKKLRKFGLFDFDHPVFRRIFEASGTGWSDVLVYRSCKVTLPPEAAVPIRFDNGAPAVAELPVGIGKLWLFMMKFTPESTSWAGHYSFLPFWRELEKYAAGTVAAAAPLPGDVVRLAQGERAEFDDGSGPKPVQAAGGFLTFDRPGNYRAGERFFSVNLPPEESDCAPDPVDDRAAQFQTAAPGAIVPAAAQTGGGKTELYAYFILAALLLLVSELALANRTAL
ncbi:MAG TPA: BatA domain-containing protein [Victivallis vadensis]|nr:BatA domain-containing protein [Victivallis vadensis]